MLVPKCIDMSRYESMLYPSVNSATHNILNLNRKSLIINKSNNFIIKNIINPSRQCLDSQKSLIDFKLILYSNDGPVAYVDRPGLHMGINCAANCIRCSQKNSSVCLDCMRDTDSLVNGICQTKCPKQYFYYN